MTAQLIASLVRLHALLTKEFLQLLRDPRMRFFVVLPPLVQLVIFGYAASFDVRHADIAIVDHSRTQATRELLAAITATGHYRAIHVPDMKAAARAMDRNEIRAIVQFDIDFHTSRRIQLIADGSDSNSALIIVGELSRIIRRHVEQTHNLQPLINIEERAWFNPNLDDRDYFVPGVIANVVLIATMILTAMSVVREREIGTLERLLVTPVARFEFIIAKMMPVAFVGLFDVLLVTTVAVLWFEIPFRGSIWALFISTLLYLASTLGLGLLISSYSSTQQQAMLLALFVIMPAVILSGFAFPIRNMPEFVQLLTYLDPLRYYLVIIRDIFLKGAGFSAHFFEYGMMALLGGVALLLSALKVR